MNKQALFFLLLIMQLSMPKLLLAQTDFDRIIQNVIAEQKIGLRSNSTSINSGTTTVMNNLAANGSWTDITYNNDAAYNPPLPRLRQMALAYTFNGATHYNSPTLYAKIVSALQYWNNANYDAANWYSDEIGYPHLLGQMLILMRGSSGTTQLPAADEADAINYLSTRLDPSSNTGANRVDEALHWIYRGALTQNSVAVNNALANIKSTMVQVNKGEEGINPDNAFLQHNAQLMTQSYGSEFLNSVYDAGLFLAGTSYTFTQAELDVVYRFAHHSFYGGARGRYKDFSLDGRGISRENNGSMTANIARKAKVVDPLHAADFTDDSLRVTGARPSSYNVTTPYNIHYFTGDYTLHNRPGYSFSVRSNSTRTVRTESINGENLLGKWLSDGATNIRVDGGEYYNIFPVWDWNKIPGITMRQYATPQTNTNGTTSYGTTSFVGGVSDSSYGASVYQQSNGSVLARKGYFFFDEEVVCLGSGITSSQAEAVATTVNQTLLNGNVTVKASGTTTVQAAGTQQNFTGNAVDWVYHNKVGYYFPSGGNVTISNQSQSGKWSNINSGEPSTTVTSEVFKLWLSHGSTPSNATYAYVVVPNVADAAQMNTYNGANVEVVRNSVNQQAVKHVGLNMLSVLFYAAGTVPITGTQLTSITADKPCAVLVKYINTPNVEIHISDPAQQNSVINLTLTFASGSPQLISCTMPSGNRSGATIKVTSGLTVLPLTLVDFTASPGSNGSVQLKWQTASEDYVSHFEVERKVEGQPSFVHLLKQNAVGTGNHHYSDIDQHPATGVNVYRLKTVDRDGRFSYSKTISIKIAGRNHEKLLIYPNPVSNSFSLLHGERGGNIIMHINAADGKTVMAKTILPGVVQTLVDISALKPGWYMVTVINGRQVQSAGFVKE